MLQIAVCEDEQADRNNLIGIFKALLLLRTRAEDYVLCGLYQGVTMEDAEILDQMLTELSLSGNLHIGYMGEPTTDICDEIIYL